MGAAQTTETKTIAADALSASLLLSEKFSDLTLVSTDGERFPAHRVILGTRCPAFLEVLEEYSQGNEHRTTLKAEVLREFLSYLYASSIEDLSEMAVRNLIEVAHEFKLDELKNLCTEKLGRSMTIESVVDTLVVAHNHGLEDLKERSKKYITKNLGAVSSTPQFANLSKLHPCLWNELVLWLWCCSGLPSNIDELSPDLKIQLILYHMRKNQI